MCKSVTSFDTCHDSKTKAFTYTGINLENVQQWANMWPTYILELIIIGLLSVARK